LNRAAIFMSLIFKLIFNPSLILADGDVGDGDGEEK
jgi:hypothetical protein